MARFLGARVAERTDFELVQAYMDTFLRVHGRRIRKDPALREACGALRTAQEQAWADFEGVIQETMILGSFLAGLQ